MKKHLIVLISLFSSVSLFSQVGINTENPLQVFHVDGGKDNPNVGNPSIEQQENDFVVSHFGNVGIGNYDPNVKLDIKTAGTKENPIAGFKLVDGNQGVNKALVSDFNGIGTWQPIAMSFFTKSFSGAPAFTLPADTGVGIGIGSVRYTGQYIDLPPGKWAINMVLVMTFSSLPIYTQGTNFVRIRLEDTMQNYDATISTNVSNDAITPRVASTGFPHSMTLGTLNGMLAVNNQSNNIKRYYFHVDNAASTGGQPAITIQFGWDESFLTYYQIK